MENDPQGIARELPRYKCHKQVWALKIAGLDPATSTILPEEAESYAPFGVDPDYFAKHNPHVGGYYVVYADGYKSFSPCEAFEDGYTRL